MYCKNCGNKLNEGSNFCGSCGTPVNNTNQSVTLVPNVAPSQPIKSSKAPLIVAIIIFVIMIISFFVVFGIIIITTVLEEVDNYPLDNIGEQITTKKLINNDVSLEYSAEWIEFPDEDNIKIIQKATQTIKLGYSTSDYYYTTDKAAEEIKTELTEKGAIVLEDFQNTTINGLTWKKLVCELNNNKYLFLVYSNKYDIYVFSYQATNSESYSANIAEVEKIYKTLKLDTSKQKQAEKNAKAKLIGEWDWGISGYFVIENDKIYVYKDSSKSLDNVFYGTYTADDKIATYGTGYAEGMYVVMTVEKYYVDGKEITIKNNKIDFAFSPNNDGTYTIKNMSTYNSNIATKVK